MAALPSEPSMDIQYDISQVEDPDDKRKVVRIIFDEFDTDASGFIDHTELKNCCEKMGVNMSAEKLEETMKELDTDFDQQISFDEFYTWFINRTANKRKFQSTNADGNETVDGDVVNADGCPANEPLEGLDLVSQKLKKRLFKFDCTIDKENNTQGLKYEIAETADYMVVCLELPGLQLCSAGTKSFGYNPNNNITTKFSRTQEGFSISIKANKRSAFEEMKKQVMVDTDTILSKRILGMIEFGCEVKGVFEGKPEVRYKAGILRIRFKKYFDADHVDVVVQD